MKTHILDFFLQMVKKGRVKKILSKNGEKLKGRKGLYWVTVFIFYFSLLCCRLEYYLPQRFPEVDVLINGIENSLQPTGHHVFLTYF